MSDSKTARGWGDSMKKSLARLLLDAENPRLPANLQGGSQVELAVSLDLGFEAFAVAESIAEHGYFASEPLIVIPSPAEPDTWIVVEGNRRLTALMGLARADVRSQLPEPDKWDAIAISAGITVDTEIPVVAAPSRLAVVPVIGYRHISGILAWQPFAQARYVAKLVDSDKLSVSEVSKMIGIEKTRAGNLYREQAIAKQAQALGIETGNLEAAFSLLTVAMSQTKLRDFISAPLGSAVEPGKDPIPVAKVEELTELLGWLYGDDNNEPKISDSREISKLANVIANPVGLAALRAGDKLAIAQQKIEDQGLDTLERLRRRLNAAKNALQGASEDISEHAGKSEIEQLLEEIEDAFAALNIDTDPEVV